MTRPADAVTLQAAPALPAQRVRSSEGEEGQASPAQGTTHLVLVGPWWSDPPTQAHCVQ